MNRPLILYFTALGNRTDIKAYNLFSEVVLGLR